jgi:hypothetical protein
MHRSYLPRSASPSVSDSDSDSNENTLTENSEVTNSNSYQTTN